MCSKNKMNKPKSKYPKKLIVFAFDSKIIDAWVGGYAFPLLLTIFSKFTTLSFGYHYNQ